MASSIREKLRLDQCQGASPGTVDLGFWGGPCALLNQKRRCIEKALVLNNLSILKPPADGHLQSNVFFRFAFALWIEKQAHVKMPPYNISGCDDLFRMEAVEGVILGQDGKDRQKPWPILIFAAKAE